MLIAMLWVIWYIFPIIGGKTAPPIIDITNNEPPSLVLVPRSFIPRAKIVGNIRDIKKLVMNSDHIPSAPGFRIATETSIILIML